MAHYKKTKEIKGIFVQTKNMMFAFSYVYEQNGINFFILPVADIPEIEECLYLFDNYNNGLECNT